MERLFLLAPDGDAAPVVEVLTAAGYDVAQAAGAESAELHAIRPPPALLIVDMRRTEVDLAALLKPMGETAPPVLVLVDEATLESPALEQTGDVIVEPWGVRELLARVRLLILRFHGDSDGNRLRRGDLTIDVANYHVTVAGEAVDLTYKEYELLKFLATNDGKVFTREALLNRVWGYNYYGGARTVDVHIRRIRSKLEPWGATYIETVRNVGYRFCAR
jgi:two-component system, OmpR family, alkaline phosphatase synthesis response regulator PhoP